MKLFKSSINDKLVGEVFDRYKVLKKLFHNNVKVFDIGANIGQTIYEISLNFNSSVIHSFEPQKICIPEIKKVSSKLNSNHKVIVNNLAVGEKVVKKKKFFQNKSSDLSSFLKVNLDSKLQIKMKKLSQKKKKLEEINNPIYVSQTTIDEYTKKYKINDIDIMKIDTQGYEQNVLLGSIKTLKNVKVICLEINFWDYYEKNQSFFEIEGIIRK